MRVLEGKPNKQTLIKGFIHLDHVPLCLTTKWRRMNKLLLPQFVIHILYESKSSFINVAALSLSQKWFPPVLAWYSFLLRTIQVIMRRISHILIPSLGIITLFSHMGSIPWSLNMSIISCGPRTKQEYLFTIHTFTLTLGNLRGVILPALSTRIIIHPGIIH